MSVLESTRARASAVAAGLTAEVAASEAVMEDEEVKIARCFADWKRESEEKEKQVVSSVSSMQQSMHRHDRSCHFLFQAFKVSEIESLLFANASFYANIGPWDEIRDLASERIHFVWPKDAPLDQLKALLTLKTLGSLSMTRLGRRYALQHCVIVLQ